MKIHSAVQDVTDERNEADVKRRFRMIVVLRPDTSREQRDQLIGWLKAQNVDVHISEGKVYTVLGLVGNTGNIDEELVESLSIVDSVKHVSEPFKKSNRKFHPENTVVRVGNAVFGDGACTLIAGPCAPGDPDEMTALAKKLKKAGAAVFKADMFAHTMSPYDSGNRSGSCVEVLSEVKKATGLAIAAEVMDAAQIERADCADILMVGRRNMGNLELLRELGRSDRPVILRRDRSAELKELLMSAEYIMAGGNENVILCESGIRTFESYTRNTMDMSALPLLHELSHLPVIAEPCRATGLSRLTHSMSMAAAACGADGIMLDVCEDPMKAPYDGGQMITTEQFEKTALGIASIREVMR